MKYLSLNRREDQKSVYQHKIKLGNLKHAFDLVRSGKCTSRSELAREMKLSATAVSSLTDELIRLDLLIETGPIHAETPGRRPMSLKINEKARQIAVFSLNSGELRFTLFDLAFNVLEESVFPYENKIVCSEDRGDHYSALFEDVLLNKSRCVNRDRLIAVCVSFPGIYLTHEHFFTARTSLDAVIKSDTLENFTRNIGAPAFVANRSMCMAYAEKNLRASRGEAADDLLFVHISEYVGSAIISGGNIYTGPNDTAGDIAHLRVDNQGRRCACGGLDCLHHYLNTAALLKDAQEACCAENLPAPRDFSELAALYGKNSAVDRVISVAAKRLAHALSMLIYITAADRIVISGSIRAFGEKFLQEIGASLNELIYARHHTISFAETDNTADSIGIAQYLLDKTDEILAAHS